MEESSVKVSVKEVAVTPSVANFQCYMNLHLVRSYISTCKTPIVKPKVTQNKQGTVLSSLLRFNVLFVSLPL